jgi:hypothetical protein
MKTSTSAPEIMSWDEIKQAMAETRPTVIAALKYDEQSDLYALKQGMFVLHVVGEDLFSLTEPKNRMVL